MSKETFVYELQDCYFVYLILIIIKFFSMKKWSLFLNIILSAIIIFIGCKSISNTPFKVDKKKCSTCMEYNNVKKPSTLDLNLLRAMTYNYQVPNGVVDNVKTRSVWLSLDKLKQFIYEIESKTCDCPEQKLGVRVYFGVYPADHEWVSSNPNGFWNDLDNPNHSDGKFRDSVLQKSSTHTNDYANRLSIFMVPTMYDGNRNVDFDPNNMLNGCKPGYNIELFKANTLKSGKIKENDQFDNPAWFTKNAMGTSVTALSATNHGDMCPPPYNNCQNEGSYDGFDN